MKRPDALVATQRFFDLRATGCSVSPDFAGEPGSWRIAGRREPLLSRTLSCWRVVIFDRQAKQRPIGHSDHQELVEALKFMAAVQAMGHNVTLLPPEIGNGSDTVTTNLPPHLVPQFAVR